MVEIVWPIYGFQQSGRELPFYPCTEITFLLRKLIVGPKCYCGLDVPNNRRALPLCTASVLAPLWRVPTF